MWGDVGRCGEMWGDVGRCGEMWGGGCSYRKITSSCAWLVTSTSAILASLAPPLPRAPPPARTFASSAAYPSRKRVASIRPVSRSVTAPSAPTAARCTVGTSDGWSASQSTDRWSSLLITAAHCSTVTRPLAAPPPPPAASPRLAASENPSASRWRWATIISRSVRSARAEEAAPVPSSCPSCVYLPRGANGGEEGEGGKLRVRVMWLWAVRACTRKRSTCARRRRGARPPPGSSHCHQGLHAPKHDRMAGEYRRSQLASTVGDDCWERVVGCGWMWVAHSQPAGGGETASVRRGRPRETKGW